MSILRHLLLTSFIFIIASCSDKQFAFRQKVRVQQQHAQKVNQRKIDAMTMMPSDIAQPLISNSSVISEKRKDETLLAVPPLVNKPIHMESDSTKKKKYKFDDDPASDDGSINNKENSSDSDYYDYDADNMAIAGFVFSLASVFLFFTFIPGFIYSIRGLKSKRYKGLAIVGLVISSIFLILSVILLLYFLFFLLLFIVMIM